MTLATIRPVSARAGTSRGESVAPRVAVQIDLDAHETMSVAGKRRTEYADDAPPERLAPLGAALSLEGKLQ